MKTIAVSAVIRIQLDVDELPWDDEQRIINKLGTAVDWEDIELSIRQQLEDSEPELSEVKVSLYECMPLPKKPQKVYAK